MVYSSVVNLIKMVSQAAATVIAAASKLMLHDTSDFPVSDVSFDEQQYLNATYDEYREIVFEHIFPRPYEWILICINIIVLIVGLLGNFLVCFVAYRDPKMQKNICFLFIWLSLIFAYCSSVYLRPLFGMSLKPGFSEVGLVNSLSIFK